MATWSMMMFGQMLSQFEQEADIYVSVDTDVPFEYAGRVKFSPYVPLDRALVITPGKDVTSGDVVQIVELYILEDADA